MRVSSYIGSASDNAATTEVGSRLSRHRRHQRRLNGLLRLAMLPDAQPTAYDSQYSAGYHVGIGRYPRALLLRRHCMMRNEPNRRSRDSFRYQPTRERIGKFSYQSCDYAFEHFSSPSVSLLLYTLAVSAASPFDTATC